MNLSNGFIACFIVFVIMIFHNVSFSQDLDNILIEGLVIDENDDPVPFVNIANLTYSKGTASNDEGRFSIIMKAQDTLMFSSVGFKSYYFTIYKEVATKQLNVTIQMNSISLELEPVKVFAYKNEQAFKQAIINMKVNVPVNERIKIPGIKYGEMREVKPNILSPVSLVQGLFSKEMKEQKKYAKVTQEFESWKQQVYLKYNPIIVQEITGLKEDEIDYFMKFCEIGESFIRLSNQYEITLAVQQCFDKFNKQHNDIEMEN